jgi:hypothetical protein
MRAGWLAALVVVVTALGACIPDPPKQPSAEVMNAPVCQPAKHRWRDKPPHMDEEKIYGTGVGASEDEAVGHARRRAAETLRVQVVAQSTNHLVDWSKSKDGQKLAGGTEKEFSSTTTALIDQDLEGCRIDDECRDPENKLSVLVSCFRHPELDRELRRAAEKMAAEVPDGAIVLLVPGNNEDGWITGLGEYAAAVVRGPLATAMEKRSAKLVRVEKWVPVDLHEVARANKVTHLLRIEHHSAGRQRVRFNLSLLDARDDVTLPGSSTFEVRIAPFQLELLELKGPLLPQKDAMGLAANLGAARAKLSLSQNDLKEGDHVEIVFTLDRDGWVYLFQMEEDGTATLMIPSPDSPDNHFSAGEHRIPDEKWKANGDALIACPLPGHAVTRENLKIIVATQPLPLVEPGVAKNDMKTFSVGPQGDLGVLVKKLNQLKAAGAQFSDATMPYTIVAMPGAKSNCPK